MLTAKKENDQLKANVFGQRSPTTRSFDRVVNSIDGLRERVQGFSVEQLSEVNQGLHAMSLRLVELQKTLGVIAEIKEQLDPLRTKVKRAEAESLEQNSLATLDRPMPLHSIAQVGNLLKFQRVIKSLKGAKNVSGGLAFADSRSRQPVPPKPAEIVSEPLDRANKTQEFTADLPAIEYTFTEGSASEANVVTVATVSDNSDTLLHRGPPEIDPEPALATPVEYGFELPMNSQWPAADLTAIKHPLVEDSARETNAVAVSEIPHDSETLLHLAPAQLDFERNERFSNDSAIPTFLYDNTASIHGQGINAEFPDTSDRPGRSYAIPDAETEAVSMQMNMEVSSEVDFDQRLLDDLIKNYGEFNVFPNSPAEAETRRENLDQNRITMPGVDPTTTLNPVSQQNLPAQRKDGELDLKLKKLIKDYGEYDLYSRQSPINLKTGVAAAFLVLALAFSGFYFFSPRRSVAPSNAPNASRPENSAETASKELATKDATRVEETLSAPSASNVDVPKSLEAEGSRNLPNKVTPKKTK
jgi:hypothetical protein